MSTLNGKAWENLFEHFDILNQIEKKDFFEISAEQIKNVSGREPRLITKIDFSSQLPSIFKANGIGILPNTRGSYILSKFNLFADFPEIYDEITAVVMLPHIETIDPDVITSESAAINCAYVSGIIEDFTGDKKILPTVNGRMSSGSFNFNIIGNNGRTMNFDVLNSQIEIDGGYEGENTFSIIEAKNSISKDFVIRQLYYPYRLWEGKTRKETKLIYLTYSNGIYTLYEYRYDDKFSYNDIILARSKRYRIYSSRFSKSEIEDSIRKIKIVPEPEVPFPQANSFEKVINFMEILQSGPKTKEEIASEFDFDERQSDYYFNATKYLGFTQKTTDLGLSSYRLSSSGERLMKLALNQRQLELIKAVLSHKVFMEVYLTGGNSKQLEIHEVSAIMKNHSLYGINSESTILRRASTVDAWINWIRSVIREMTS